MNLARRLTAPPAARILETARVAIDQNKKTHEELVIILRSVLRPGGSVRWTSLRRTLTLVGYRRYAARTWQVMAACLELHPMSRTGREGTRSRGPRCIKGVRLVVDLPALRKAIAGKWEKHLPPAELTPIPNELTTPLLSINKATRLGELVTSVHARAEESSRYYSLATTYLHTNGWAHFPRGHKRIWALHCEGATKEEISVETRTAPTTVQDAIQLHRARAGIVQT